MLQSSNIINKFSINDAVISTKSSFKDLGIDISHNLKWSTHIAFLKSNALVIVFQILKFFRTKNVWILLKLCIYNVHASPAGI